MKDKISEEQLNNVLKIKEACMVMNIDTEYIAFMPEQINNIAIGLEKTVIFTEIAGIKVCNIVGIDEE